LRTIPLSLCGECIRIAAKGSCCGQPPHHHPSLIDIELMHIDIGVDLLVPTAPRALRLRRLVA